VFKWCSYRQRFIGEMDPADAYRISHGMCPKCASVEDFELLENTTRSSVAEKLIKSLFSAYSRNEFLDAKTFLFEAAEARITRTEILIGLLQPALYDIGEQWARAQIDPPKERSFIA
jgi:hypothetical protein